MASYQNPRPAVVTVRDDPVVVLVAVVVIVAGAGGPAEWVLVDDEAWWWVLVDAEAWWPPHPTAHTPMHAAARKKRPRITSWRAMRMGAIRVSNTARIIAQHRFDTTNAKTSACG